MKGRDLRRARTEVAATREALAELTDLTPEILGEWEQLDARIPKESAQRLEWAIWTLKQERVLANSGLPVCERVAELAEDGAGPDVVLQHAEECEVCRAREEYARKHAPPMPGSAGLVVRLLSFSERLPGVLQSAFNGFLMVLLFTGIPVLFMLVGGTLESDAGMVGGALALLAVTASGGGAGGVVHYYTRGLRERGTIGYYISWTLAVYGYVLGVFGIAAVGIAIFGPEVLDAETLEMVDFATTPAGWVMLAVLGAFFGVVAGRGTRQADRELLEELEAWEQEREKPRRRLTFARVRKGFLYVLLVGGGLALQFFAREDPDGRTGGDYDEALPGLIEAARADPENADVQRELAYALSRLDRFEEAAGAAREAVRLEPQDAWARSFLARMLFEVKRYEEALPEAEQAVAIERDSPLYQETLGLVLIGLGREEEAVPRYREATRLAPDDARLWRDLARLAHMLRDYENAADAYEQVHRLDADYFDERVQDREMWEEARRLVER